MTLPGGATDRPAVENSASAKQIKKARKLTRLTEHMKTEALRRLLDGCATAEDFKVFYWELLGHCLVFKQVPSDAPTKLLRYAEGKRNIGLRYITKLAKAKAGALTEMMQMHSSQTSHTTRRPPHEDHPLASIPALRDGSAVTAHGAAR
jgi:hypothetical protein